MLHPKTSFSPKKPCKLAGDQEIYRCLCFLATAGDMIMAFMDLGCS